MHEKNFPWLPVGSCQWHEMNTFFIWLFKSQTVLDLLAQIQIIQRVISYSLLLCFEPPRMWIGGLKRWLDVVSSKPSFWIMTKNMLNSVKSMLYFYLDNSVKTDFYWITTCPFYVRLYVDSLTLIQWFTLDIWKLLISICVGLCNVGDTE